MPTSHLCPAAAGAAAVISVLQITFQPYACRLLDTLRRLAVYGLMSTCFMLMLVTLSEAQDHDRLLAACMIIVALINTGEASEVVACLLAAAVKLRQEAAQKLDLDCSLCCGPSLTAAQV